MWTAFYSYCQDKSQPKIKTVVTVQFPELGEKYLSLHMNSSNEEEGYLTFLSIK